MQVFKGVLADEILGSVAEHLLYRRALVADRAVDLEHGEDVRSEAEEGMSMLSPAPA